MCCQHKSVKTFIVVCSILTILGGLAFLALTFNMLMSTDWTMKSSPIANSTYVTARSPDALAQFSIYIAGIAFALAVLAILFGIFGICTLTF